MYIFPAVTMKDVVFWNSTPCGCSKKNRRFGGAYRLLLRATTLFVFSAHSEDVPDTVLLP
jgi:hypothetical protein